MAVVWNRQYRPVSTSETGTDDVLSVRALRDLADSVNNYRFCVGNFKVIFEIYPGDDSLTYSAGATFSERVIREFAPVYRPRCYDGFAVQVCHRLTAGTGTFTWKLYMLPAKYVGSRTTVSLTGYDIKPSCSITSDSTSYSINNEALTGVTFGDVDTPIYPLLTLSGVDCSSAIARLYALDVTPMNSQRLLGGW